MLYDGSTISLVDKKDSSSTAQSNKGDRRRPNTPFTLRLLSSGQGMNDVIMESRLQSKQTQFEPTAHLKVLRVGLQNEQQVVGSELRLGVKEDAVPCVRVVHVEEGGQRLGRLLDVLLWVEAVEVVGGSLLVAQLVGTQDVEADLRK
jgi:hypothetical protein